MNKNNKQTFLTGFFLCALIFFAIGATYYKQITGPTSSADNAILRWDGIRGEKAQNSSITILDNGTLGNGTWSIDTNGNAVFLSATYSELNISSLSLSNPIPSSYVTNSTANRVAMFGADYKLTYDIAETGTGALVRSNTPVLSNPTLNDSVTFEQTVLSAHSSVTNFVVDPTISSYQTINAALTTSFVTVGFLHATNLAAGKGTTILVFAGTNATVTVSLSTVFPNRNTNSVTLTTGKILPVSFYAYGSNPTNVIATMGTVY